jgi:hypothetical protein
LPCPEHVRLRQRYESALRHWGNVLLSQDSALVGASAQQRAQLKQNALDERDAANRRVRVHERTCPACRGQNRRRSFAARPSRLVTDLLVRMALEGESPAWLRTVRELLAKWLLENPDDATVKKLKKCTAEIDARLEVLGRKEPGAVSNLARDIVDELELPGNPMMLEFLTGAEALLTADGTAPENIRELLTQAGWEYALMLAEEGKKRHIQ